MAWQDDLTAGGRLPSHRERYRDQYAHWLVGKWVNVIDPESGAIVARGEVERIVSSRWGELAHLKGGGDAWWLRSACHTADPGAAA